MGVRINKDLMASKARMGIVEDISKLADDLAKPMVLPCIKAVCRYIRTQLSARVVKEMRMFILASLILSAIILYYSSAASAPCGFPDGCFAWRDLELCNHPVIWI
jgi:hypothetical protein